MYSQGGQQERLSSLVDAAGSVGSAAARSLAPRVG